MRIYLSSHLVEHCAHITGSSLEEEEDGEDKVNDLRKRRISKKRKSHWTSFLVELIFVELLFALGEVRNQLFL